MADCPPTPSFVLLDVADGGRATVYVYELVDGSIKVDKLEFSQTRNRARVL